MANDSEVMRAWLDYIARQSGYGEMSTTVASSINGIDHRGIATPMPRNTDGVGLTFFTRPCLNLSDDNLSLDRVFTPLLGTNPISYQRAVRALLDPWGENSGALLKTPCPLVDPNNPFITILTNHMVSISGWPDPVFNHFQSKEGPAKESWAMIDDVARNFGQFSLNATFRSVAGDPIRLLLNMWTRYAARVYDGTMMPYPIMIVDNEIDYQTRIYRLVLDPSRNFVQKIAATGAAFPVSPALGGAFNVSGNDPFSGEAGDDISIPFQCIGVDYNDPILIEEFNTVVRMFNRAMNFVSNNRAQQEGKTSTLIRVPYEHLMFFNKSRCYPFIDPYTSELQWWVTMNEYSRLDSVPELRKPDAVRSSSRTPIPPEPSTGYGSLLKKHAGPE